jgi:transposase
MDVLHPRCAGLDVHQKSVVACRRRTSNGKVRRETQSFGTTTAELVRLTAWLTTHACTHVALESTGVYWQPVGHVLERHFTLVLANAMHIRNIPGRQSDVKDAEWIADLLARGLIRGSFVPPAAIQELRQLTRTRKQLVREIARPTLRLQKTLEDANIKLTSVLSHLIGASGRAILAALIAGEQDPDCLAALMRGRVKAPRAERIAALHGRVTPHHRFILALHVDQIDGLEAAVRKLEPRVDERLVPFQADVNRLITMPGVSLIVASVRVAEIGVDMTRSPTAGHLVSWAGLCPRPSFSASRHGADRRRRWSRARPPSSPPPTPCSNTAWSTVIWARTTSSGATRRSSPSA